MIRSEASWPCLKWNVQHSWPAAVSLGIPAPATGRAHTPPRESPMRSDLWLRLVVVLPLAAALGAADGDVPAHRRYGAWRSGAIGGGGYLQHVVWAPGDARRMYLTSDVGGCFRSDDAGA